MHCDLRRLFTPFFTSARRLALNSCLQNSPGGKGRMYTRFRKIIPFIKGNSDAFILAFILMFGYFIGTLLAAETPSAFSSLIRGAAKSPVSMVGSFVYVFSPLVLAFAAVHYRKPAFLFLICFSKAVLFAHCSFCCCLTFSSGGWLVRLLLLFSDIMMFPVLCRFTMCYLGQPKPLSRRDVLFCTGTAAFVAIVNFCFISPFLAMLIDT